MALRACQEIRFGETYINRENFEAMQGFHAGWRKSGIGGADGKARSLRIHPDACRLHAAQLTRICFMSYDFLVETYDTERIKVVSVWSEFRDDDPRFARATATPAGVAFTSKWCINVSVKTLGSVPCWASMWAAALAHAGDPAEFHPALCGG